jgi:hypothetical protein
MTVAPGRVMRHLGLLVIGLALAACVTGPTPTPSRSLGVGERWLPVADFGADGLCGGAGYVGEFRLHGAADDPRLAWMIGPDGRRELAWPVGFSARFTPTLQVFDERGRLVASEGALVTGGCPTDDAGVTYPDFSAPSP